MSCLLHCRLVMFKVQYTRLCDSLQHDLCVCVHIMSQLYEPSSCPEIVTHGTHTHTWRCCPWFVSCLLHCGLTMFTALWTRVYDCLQHGLCLCVMLASLWTHHVHSIVDSCV